MSHLSQRPDQAAVGLTIPHESAALHVTGAALYTDDQVGRTRAVLHAHPVQAPHAHAWVTGMRVEAAYDVPGVVRVLTADDVPGVNDAGVKDDEPLFPSEVMYVGDRVIQTRNDYQLDVMNGEVGSIVAKDVLRRDS